MTFAKQVAQYMLHAATGFATFRKVEDCSTFSATCFAIYCCVASCTERCYMCNFVSNLLRIGIALQIAEKIASCNTAFSTSNMIWNSGFNSTSLFFIDWVCRFKRETSQNFLCTAWELGDCKVAEFKIFFHHFPDFLLILFLFVC